MSDCVAGGPPPNDVSNQIRSYRDFKHGWDGYQGAVFTEKTVRAAIMLCSMLVKEMWSLKCNVDPAWKLVQPTYFDSCPCPDGSIDIYLTAGPNSLTFGVDDEFYSVTLNDTPTYKAKHKFFSFSEFYWGLIRQKA